jgi:hypothetical protein
MPQNQGVSTAPKQTKAQRQAEQRAAQLESFKKKQAAQKRNRILTIALSIFGALAVLALVAVVIIINVQPKPSDASLDNVVTFTDLEQTHVEGTVDYPMTPPAGGPHNAAWLNCGIYSEPQQNENAVHALEHGAIWITYDPDLPESDVAILKDRTPSEYAILSPYPDLGVPMAISAWGAQYKFTDPSDPVVDAFISKYWRSADSPEPGAPCTGALDGPGKE